MYSRGKEEENTKQKDFNGFLVYAHERAPDEFDIFRPPKLRKLDLEEIKKTKKIKHKVENKYANCSENLFGPPTQNTKELKEESEMLRRIDYSSDCKHLKGGKNTKHVCHHDFENKVLPSLFSKFNNDNNGENHEVVIYTRNVNFTFRREKSLTEEEINEMIGEIGNNNNDANNKDNDNDIDISNKKSEIKEENKQPKVDDKMANKGEKTEIKDTSSKNTIVIDDEEDEISTQESSQEDEEMETGDIKEIDNISTTTSTTSTSPLPIPKKEETLHALYDSDFDDDMDDSDSDDEDDYYSDAEMTNLALLISKIPHTRKVKVIQNPLRVQLIDDINTKMVHVYDQTGEEIFKENIFEFLNRFTFFNYFEYEEYFNSASSPWRLEFLATSDWSSENSYQIAYGFRGKYISETITKVIDIRLTLYLDSQRLRLMVENGFSVPLRDYLFTSKLIQSEEGITGYSIKEFLGGPLNISFLNNPHNDYRLQLRANQLATKLTKSMNETMKVFDECSNSSSKNDTIFPLISQPSELKIKLFDYQIEALSWMKFLEDKSKISFSIPTLSELFDHVFYSRERNYRRFETQQEFLKISAKGGIYADQMGLGKTLVMISLVLSNPSNPIHFKIKPHSKYIPTKATLILCPNHLAKQWEDEILLNFHPAALERVKVILITTKLQWSKVCYQDLMEADFVIVSFQFISNNCYKSLWSPTVNSSSANNNNNNNNRIEKHSLPSYRFDMEEIEFSLYNNRPDTINLNTQNNNNNNNNYDNDDDFYFSQLKRRPDALLSICPLFSHLFWHRLIIDEGHEVFNSTRSSSSPSFSKFSAPITKNKPQIDPHLHQLQSRFRWYVSGTPFPCGIDSFYEVSKFLRFSPDLQSLNAAAMPLLDATRNHIFWRNTKESVGSEYAIPQLIEEVKYFDLSSVENAMYAAAFSNDQRRQICCHPQISAEDRNILGDKPKKLEEIRETMIKHKTAKKTKIAVMITELTEHLESLNAETEKSMITRIQNQISTLQKQIEDLTCSISYFESISPNISQSTNDSCSICLSEFTDMTITTCGHIYCFACIKEALRTNQSCPLCRQPLRSAQLMRVLEESQIEKINEDHDFAHLVSSYGSKMAHLITMIKKLFKEADENDNNNNNNNNNNNDNNEKPRIIIFSQWDNMLHRIGDTLAENNISHVYCSGSIYKKWKAIKSFKGQLPTSKRQQESEIRVIMLSLENAASGTNLTEATHIFFMDPVAKSRQEARDIESQAIGRAVRQGQKKTVHIVRLLARNTIEQELYERNYANDDNKDIEILNN